MPGLGLSVPTDETPLQFKSITHILFAVAEPGAEVRTITARNIISTDSESVYRAAVL